MPLSNDAQVCLAVDLGATSGRVIAGIYEEGRIQLDEVHRFPTVGVRFQSGYYWDMVGLYRSILGGLRIAGGKYPRRIASIGVDTWGVDYALLENGGGLLGNPFQYWDSRTDGAQEGIQKLVPLETVYEETGIQHMFFNTLYQLYAERQVNELKLKAAKDLLFLPDLLSYWLCGTKIQEETIASTSQLWNPRNRKWSSKILKAVGLNESLFHDVTRPGTRLGTLLPSVKKETALGDVSVVAVAGHDTQSAICGSPLSTEDPCFLSSGTWSLMGMELDSPLINKDTMAGGFSNEAGVDGKTCFLKNLCGMWLIEELRRHWMGEKHVISYKDLWEQARAAKPFLTLIDPDDPRFSSPGGMVEKIESFCRETKQPAPQSSGEFARVVLESLACKYAIVFDQLQAVSGKQLNSLRIVGGGCQNTLLNQFTSNALGKSVFAGPIEATAMGNIIVQLQGLGLVDSLQTGRQIIENSFVHSTYTPEDTGIWQEAVDRLKGLMPQ